MDNWDQKKLEEVVNSKAGKQPPTDIVCKYFLEAIESNNIAMGILIGGISLSIGLINGACLS